MMSCHFKCDKTLSHSSYYIYPGSIGDLLHRLVVRLQRTLQVLYSPKFIFFAFSPSQVCTDKGCISFWYLNDSANLPVVVLLRRSLNRRVKALFFDLIRDDPFFGGSSGQGNFHLVKDSLNM